MGVGKEEKNGGWEKEKERGGEVRDRRRKRSLENFRQFPRDVVDAFAAPVARY